MIADCTVLYFKPTGKWKYEGRGFFPRADNVNHDAIHNANGGMPGISSDGKHFTVVVIPDEDCEAPFAYPRMLIGESE
jgi:hypothetical protein